MERSHHIYSTGKRFEINPTGVCWDFVGYMGNVIAFVAQHLQESCWDDQCLALQHVLFGLVSYYSLPGFLTHLDVKDQ